MATKALSVSDKLRNWWTGCSNEGLRLAERAWFAFAVRTPTTVTDVDIGDGQFLHTLSVAASPAAPPSARPLVVLHGYGQGIGVWAKAVDPLHSGLGEHRRTNPNPTLTLTLTLTLSLPLSLSLSLTLTLAR